MIDAYVQTDRVLCVARLFVVVLQFCFENVILHVENAVIVWFKMGPPKKNTKKYALYLRMQAARRRNARVEQSNAKLLDKPIIKNAIKVLTEQIDKLTRRSNVHMRTTASAKSAAAQWKKHSEYYKTEATTNRRYDREIEAILFFRHCYYFYYYDS